MIEPSTVQLRNTLRQTFRERRQRLSQTEQSTAALQLIEQCIKHNIFARTLLPKPHLGHDIDAPTPLKVAIYKTNDGELDTQALIEYLWQQNIQVFLPVLHPFSDGHLLFLEYTSNSAMRANGFGILEPRLECQKVCPVKQLDVMFTPLVAFDDRGNRLGMGGGFYDRTLVSFSKNTADQKTKVIGIAHDIQKTLTLPVQAWDIPLPHILTPSRFYNFI